MFKRILKTVVVAALALALLPSQAQAIPKKFRTCQEVTKSGTTYLLYRDKAIVTRTTTRNVAIPKTVRHKGKRYAVRAIWDGALSDNKKLRKVDLRAMLECCEDDSLFIRDSRKVRITVHNRFNYEWLTDEGNDSIVRLK